MSTCSRPSPPAGSRRSPVRWASSSVAPATPPRCRRDHEPGGRRAASRRSPSARHHRCPLSMVWLVGLVRSSRRQRSGVWRHARQVELGRSSPASPSAVPVSAPRTPPLAGQRQADRGADAPRAAAVSLATLAARWLPSSRSARTRLSEPRYCTSLHRRRRPRPRRGAGRVAVDADPLRAQRVGGVDAEQSARTAAPTSTFDVPTNVATNVGRRALVDLAGRADLLDAAVVEHGDAIAHRQRLALVVGDEHERDADVALDRLQLDLHLLAQLEVERAERLVEQQHLGTVDQRPGEGDALALTAAQLVRLAVAVAATGGTASSISPARRRRSARLTPFTLRPYSTFCCTVMCGNRA